MKIIGVNLRYATVGYGVYAIAARVRTSALGRLILKLLRLVASPVSGTVYYTDPVHIAYILHNYFSEDVDKLTAVIQSREARGARRWTPHLRGNGMLPSCYPSGYWKNSQFRYSTTRPAPGWDRGSQFPSRGPIYWRCYPRRNRIARTVLTGGRHQRPMPRHQTAPMPSLKSASTGRPLPNRARNPHRLRLSPSPSSISHLRGCRCPPTRATYRLIGSRTPR